MTLALSMPRSTVAENHGVGMRISDEHRELIERLRPMDVPVVPCNDCTASVDGVEITHSVDCPVSLDVDAVCERDRDWFDRHPSADFFYRSISWGEASQLAVKSPEIGRSLPPGTQIVPEGRVRVERFAEGIRIRRFEDVYFVITTPSDSFPIEK